MKKRILIVEDVLFTRNLIKDILTKNGFEVCGEASNAIEGVRKYKELRPDLVTLDIVMPRMEEIDGIDAVKEIVSFDSLAKVVIVSALAERPLIQEALSYGAKEFVTKPFTAKRLVEVIEKVLSK